MIIAKLGDGILAFKIQLSPATPSPPRRLDETAKATVIMTHANSAKH